MPRKKIRRRSSKPIDQRSMAEAFSYPGIDPRQWVSYGRVLGVTADDPEPEVVFDEELGPLVKVTLLPSGTIVRARVASMVAGNGEAEWHPFVNGDEVVVFLVGGTERQAIIMGRLNNQIDRFPTGPGSVAGSDGGKNVFAFKRQRTPYIHEVENSWMVRHAKTGSFIGFTDEGIVSLRNGEKATLLLGLDAISLAGPSDATTPPQFLAQYVVDANVLSIQVGDSQVVVGATDGDTGGSWTFFVPNELVVQFGPQPPVGNWPAEHVATVEFVLATLDAFANGLLPAAGGPTAMLVVNTAVAAGGAPLSPLVATALAAGFPIAGAFPKPAPSPAGIQLLPKLGAARFRTG